MMPPPGAGELIQPGLLLGIIAVGLTLSSFTIGQYGNYRETGFEEIGPPTSGRKASHLLEPDFWTKVISGWP
jgi:hypothetical protein